jgi:hypothetical protein
MDRDAVLAALRNDPRNAHAWLQLGSILATENDILKARDAFQRALRIDPSLTAAREALASLPQPGGSTPSTHPWKQANGTATPQDQTRIAKSWPSANNFRSQSGDQANTPASPVAQPSKPPAPLTNGFHPNADTQPEIAATTSTPGTTNRRSLHLNGKAHAAATQPPPIPPEALPTEAAEPPPLAPGFSAPPPAAEASTPLSPPPGNGSLPPWLSGPTLPPQTYTLAEDGPKHRQVLGLPCPKCGELVQRAHRRPYELMISSVIPLRRYACDACDWHGTRIYWPDLRAQLPQLLAVTLAFLLVLAAGLYLLL